MDILNPFDSLALIAKRRIGHENPFPPLPGFDDVVYACKWGLTDLYPEQEKTLRDAIENRRTFDTGWAGCKKEIRSFRMISDGKVITIQTHAEMDEVNDLIYDAIDDDTEPTEEQIEEILGYWYADTEMDTETGSETTIPVTTYEAAMEAMAAMEDEDAKRLNEWFEIFKSWVNDVISA